MDLIETLKRVAAIHAADAGDRLNKALDKLEREHRWNRTLNQVGQRGVGGASPTSLYLDGALAAYHDTWSTYARLVTAFWKEGRRPLKEASDAIGELAQEQLAASAEGLAARVSSVLGEAEQGSRARQVVGRAKVELQARIRRDLDLALEREQLPQGVPVASDDRFPALRDEDVDPVTGIGGRKACDEVLDHVCRRAVLASEPFSVVLMDLDHFKSVNDTHGHLLGDEVLAETGKRLRARVAGKGRGFRWGGEEFLVALPNFTLGEGVALAEALRAAIECEPMTSKAIRVTASLGVGSFPEDGQAPADLVATTDKALYRAKEGGRNQVRAAREAALDLREGKPCEGDVTPEAVRRLRVDYFTQGQVRCPHDRAVLVAETVYQAGKRTPDLSVRCPVCGWMAEMLAEK